MHNHWLISNWEKYLSVETGRFQASRNDTDNHYRKSPNKQIDIFIIIIRLIRRANLLVSVRYIQEKGHLIIEFHLFKSQFFIGLKKY